MPLKFGNNTISTSGNYAKFGSNNLTYVKFGSNTVWTKQTTTTYTITLLGVNGSWSPSSVSGITSGSSYSFDASTKKLSVNNTVVATFYPTNNGELDNYVYSSISSSSGTITANKTITATAVLNPNINVWDLGLFISGDHTSDTASIGYFTKTRIYYRFFTYDFNTQEEYDVFEDSVDMTNNDYFNDYCDEEEQYGYGVLGVNISANTQDIDFNVAIATTGDNGITIFEAYEIRSIQ